MIAFPDYQKPLSWSEPDFTFEPFNLLFFPGGHEKGVRQMIDSAIVHKNLAAYFPQTVKPSSKGVAAICHGVLALSNASSDDGKSLLYDASTTTLPGTFESTAYWGTRLFLGDYYKTYGAGSENVEESASHSRARTVTTLANGRRFGSVLLIRSNISPA